MNKISKKLYLLPVEVSHKYISRLLKIQTYQYKLYSDMTETDHTTVNIIDIDGFIIGKHMPTKLKNTYDKTATQIKNGTSRAVTELKNVAIDVKDMVGDVASEVKDDASKAAGFAKSLINKVKEMPVWQTRNSEEDKNTVTEVDKQSN